MKWMIEKMPPQRNKQRPQDHLRKLMEDSVRSKESFVGAVKIIHNSKVININDPMESRRIKVRIPVIDDGILDELLPWCIPLIPSHLYVMPKINEHVLIVPMNPWNPTVGRYYIGPVFSNGSNEEVFEDTVNGFGFINET